MVQSLTLLLRVASTAADPTWADNRKLKCGCSSMVERQFSKLVTRVRFPSPAQKTNNSIGMPSKQEEPSKIDHAPSQPSEKLQAFALYVANAAGITDFRLLDALNQIDRQYFVPNEFADDAYINEAFPLLTGELGKISTISEVFLTLKMIDALRIEPDSKVLEIGTGSGYSTALTAHLCKHVVTIERIPELIPKAEERFAQLGITNVEMIEGDGTKGWALSGPYDRIISTTALKTIPDEFIEQLVDGGRFLIPLGEDIQNLTLVLGEKRDGTIRTMEINNVRFTPAISDNPDVGWTLEQALSLFEDEDMKEITFRDIAEAFGIPFEVYMQQVHAVFGYVDNTPEDMLRGMAPWIPTLRSASDAKYLRGNL